MPFISPIKTATLEHSVTTDILTSVADIWLSNDASAREKLLRIAAQSGVHNRRFCLPYPEILTLGGLQSRGALFEEYATPLLKGVIEAAIHGSTTHAADIDSIIFSSCSFPSIPAIDAKVIMQSELRPDINRIPIYQHGCAGGVVSLALAARLCQPERPVLVSSAELCSLVFQADNHAGEQLVAAAIFSDGAAATIIDHHEGNLEIVGARSCLLPNSTHLMGYNTFDDGFHLRLDRSLPQLLSQHIPALLQDFLKQYQLAAQDIDYWLFHPGGVRILDLLVQSLDLSQEQCHWSYDTLREHGNMSSSTILYVLEKFQNEISLSRTQYALIMGIGPGLTVEMIVLRGTC
jgi:alkylresorcinol/alkylpyrone synthase